MIKIVATILEYLLCTRKTVYTLQKYTLFSFVLTEVEEKDPVT